MRVLIVNSAPLDGGHHGGFVNGIERELQRGGHTVVTVAPTSNLRVEAFGRSAIGKVVGRTWGLRSWVRHDVLPRLRDADLVWETNADDLRFRLTRRYADELRHRRLLMTVHGPLALTTGHSLLRRAANPGVRRRLRRAQDGVPIITHTSRAADILRENGLAARSIAWPVDGVSDVGGHRRRPDRLLYVGGTRAEKGLDKILDAALRVRWPGELRWVGGPMDAAERLQQRLGDHIQWSVVAGRVADEDLAVEYARAGAVAAPYTPVFARRGGASGVVLEALAAGCVALMTPSAAATLLEVPDGAVVSDGHEIDALAAALDRLWSERHQLQAAARASGPAYIRAHGHDFAIYVASALSSRMALS